MPIDVFVSIVKLWLVLHIFHKHRVRYHDIAVGLLTFGKDTSLAIRFDFLFKIVFPRYRTKLMATSQRHGFVVLVLRIKLGIHYSTHVTVLFRQTIVNAGKALLNAFIKFDSYLSCQFFLINIKPRIFQFLLIPFEMTQNSYYIIIFIHTQQFFRLLHVFWNLCFDFCNCHNFIRSSISY